VLLLRCGATAWLPHVCAAAARTLAVLLQLTQSFLTSSIVGSRCILYFARGCQRSYCACRFLPADRRKSKAEAESRLALLHSACSCQRSYYACRFLPARGELYIIT
jgi:hypothetical protein